MLPPILDRNHQETQLKRLTNPAASDPFCGVAKWTAPHFSAGFAGRFEKAMRPP
jgi:hypothetical protein